jgi:hypothetical protein
MRSKTGLKRVNNAFITSNCAAKFKLLIGTLGERKDIAYFGRLNQIYYLDSNNF